MHDPLQMIAEQRIVKASADLEVQLSDINGGGPALEILRRLRVRAAESLHALALVNLCDPTKLTEALTLQNEVKRYDEWVVWLRQIIAEGREIDARQTAEDREELLDTLTQTPEGIQEAIGLGLVDDIPQDA